MTPIAHAAWRPGHCCSALRWGLAALAVGMLAAATLAEAQQSQGNGAPAAGRAGKPQPTAYGGRSGAGSRYPAAPPAEAAPSAAASDVTLRTQVEVAGDVIRLGDLFEGLADNADVAVARAPEPGASVGFEANYLAQLSLRYKIGWRPDSRFERVVVTRRSTAIDQDAIAYALRSAFAREGLSSELDVTFDGSQRTVHVPAGQGSALTVERLAVDRASGRFTATLSVAGTHRIQSSGRVIEMVKVPVLADRLGPEDVIRATNLRWVTLRMDRLQGDIVTDADTLIGMSPRRGLTPGTPLRANDVRPTIVVKKNSVVGMVFKTPYMTLSAQGRALEDGAQGDTIRVINTATQRTVHAQVSGPGQVKIFPTHRLASN
ncbi:MAG: flagellar basal body P-ring formation protein FlgA [Alphaproteobacteria bacterium]|nr:flagellar basal body P-ring formation protein FlgA [Alphaproteobacteria bacterium]